MDPLLAPFDDHHSFTHRWHPIEHVMLGGIWVAVASRQDLLKAALYDAALPGDKRRARLVFDANGHGISLAARNRTFRAAIMQADVVHADGGFLIPASRLLAGRKVPERSATTDMIHDFAKAPAPGLSFYLLGGTEEVNLKAATTLQKTYPNLRIVGRRNGYFGHDNEEDIISEINTVKPDVLWVGMGKPLEQEFCLRHRDRLDVAWIVTCGGCYNYITGDYRRAPEWMQSANIEWLHRAMTRPRQLFWRYFTTTPHAMLLTLMNSNRKRLFRS